MCPPAASTHFCPLTDDTQQGPRPQGQAVPKLSGWCRDQRLGVERGMHNETLVVLLWRVVGGTLASPRAVGAAGEAEQIKGSTLRRSWEGLSCTRADPASAPRPHSSPHDLTQRWDTGPGGQRNGHGGSKPPCWFSLCPSSASK